MLTSPCSSCLKLLISAKMALHTIITKHYQTPTHCTRYMYDTFGQRIRSTGLERVQAVCWKSLILNYMNIIHVCTLYNRGGGAYINMQYRHDLRFVSSSSGLFKILVFMSITIISYLYFILSTWIHQYSFTCLLIWILYCKNNPYIKITM